MNASHTLQSFDQELASIRAMVNEAGSLAAMQVVSAVEAVSRRDAALADLVISGDERIDQLEHEIEHQTISVIGRRAPLADDLRELISILKIANNLERVGDYAKNIAKRVDEIAQTPEVEPASLLPAMATLVVGMLNEALASFLGRQADVAQKVIDQDVAVDQYHERVNRLLVTQLRESPEQSAQSAHLLFVAKHLERVGDHATNIAELALFSATGERRGR